MSIITVNDQDIANRLKEVIKEKRIKSTRAFALSIDVDPSYMAKVLKCERSITETTVDAIAEKYNILPDWLLWGKGAKYGQPAPHEPHNSLVIAPIEPQVELKYVALLEKTVEEKESDLKILRSALQKISSVDEKVNVLKVTVDAHEGKWRDYEPTILGLREFVTGELAKLKKQSHESVAAALNIKVEEQRKKVEQSYIQKG